MGYPVVLNSIFEQSTLMLEAMDFGGRLALAWRRSSTGSTATAVRIDRVLLTHTDF